MTFTIVTIIFVSSFDSLFMVFLRADGELRSVTWFVPRRALRLEHCRLPTLRRKRVLAQLGICCNM